MTNEVDSKAVELWGAEAGLRMFLIRRVHERASEVKKLQTGRCFTAFFTLEFAAKGQLPTMTQGIERVERTPEQVWSALLRCMELILKADTSSKSRELRMIVEEQRQIALLRMNHEAAGVAG